MLHCLMFEHNICKEQSKIFVSYTTRDGIVSPDLLESVAETLSPYGMVFVDYLHNKSLNSQQRVIHELFLSTGLVLILSPGALASPWVKLEIYLASLLRVPLIGICHIENNRNNRYSQLLMAEDCARKTATVYNKLWVA